MTLITGIFKNSGGIAIASGILRVKLDAPLIDTETTPDSYLLQIEHDFPIVNGAIAGVDLKESASAQVSYTFSILQSFTDFNYYRLDGSFYATNQDLPSHLRADGKYYSGVSPSAESFPLERVASTREETAGESFQAIVPNVSSIDFAQLRRTGFATDRTPQTAQQVADLLRTNPSFLQSLVNLFVSQGNWIATTLYRRGNQVLVGGSTYQCLATTSINEPPLTSPAIWQLFAAKGEPGGTGGQDAAFSAAWDADLNAPSKNAVYDEIINRATIAQLNTRAPIANPALTGVPTAPTQAAGTGAPAGTNRTAIATCEYADRADAAQIQLPISATLIVGSPNPPTRTVRANGQAISRTTFSALFAIIGTTFGAGDGSTTFNVPSISVGGTTALYYVIVTGV